jgi:hypothetical protein
MLMVPAIVWRGGPARRPVTVGACAGLFFGGLAWLDSGMLISGAIDFVVLGVACGFRTGRRMTRHWPRADELSGAQRVAVLAAARRGDRIGDDSLAPVIVDYSRALHAAADKDTPLRRAVVGFVLVVAAAMAPRSYIRSSWGSSCSGGPSGAQICSPTPTARRPRRGGQTFPTEGHGRGISAGRECSGGGVITL